MVQYDERLPEAVRAAAEAPAYRQILIEAGVTPEAVRCRADFERRIPIIDKAGTFCRFPVAQLCRGGELGDLAGVLTSSGHSGRFAFGVYDRAGSAAEIEATDAALDAFFGVKSRPTLLINCLPMGVYVPTRACTLAQVSVREDMATALVRQLADGFAQVILVGETAFLKRVLEYGLEQGIDWRALRVHVIVGEEPMAENARRYVEGMLGTAGHDPERGLIMSSMGVGEVGLNLFFELPLLIRLRRCVHEHRKALEALCGVGVRHVPMLFTYQPERLFVEIAEGDDLVVSTLDPQRRIPLLRYRTGDAVQWVDAAAAAEVLRGCGEPELAEMTAGLPIIAVWGRGEAARTGDGQTVYPEAVKEGIYADPALARLTTANFRVRSGAQAVLLRIQLSPGVAAEADLAERFAAALRPYVTAPLEIRCEPYERFGSGMVVDYERKFPYVET